MELAEIMQVIPHRYPFLLVDRILELEPGRRGVGLKNVTANEPFFQGHFPGRPIMPGVLIVEALAQVGAAVLLSLEEFRGKLGLFGGIDGCRFRRQVVPGDQLLLELEVTRLRGRVARAVGTARVGGEVAAEAELTFAVADWER